MCSLFQRELEAGDQSDVSLGLKRETIATLNSDSMLDVTPMGTLSLQTVPESVRLITNL